MNGKISAVVAILAIWMGAAPAGAQTAAQNREAARQLARQQSESRYQIGVMERVLEDAVEHGASITRDRLQAVLPAQTLLLDNARVRGYRLEGYGVFFDVEVPSLETTLPWVVRTLDQNDLGLDSALKVLKAQVEASGDAGAKQALKRIELQVAPLAPLTGVATTADVSVARPVSGSAAFAPQGGAALEPSDPIINNPQDVFRAEVIQSLVDGMLDHSGALGVAVEEWLTIGARRNEVRPRIGPLESSAQTFIIRVRGSDLNAFRAGRLAREDAIKRVEVRVF